MKKHRVLKLAGSGILSSFMVLTASAGAAYRRLGSAVKNVKRVDDRGLLYSMDYTAGYDNVLTRLPILLIKAVGCSAFVSRNEAGEVITARNYDLPHTDRRGKPTGLNVIFRLRPEGKYASINLADAAWLTIAGIPYTAGALDDGKVSKAFLGFMPYLCMDGMNEKGLTVSILSLDVKAGEAAVNQQEKGKKPVVITELLRLMLDTCADVAEAVALAKNHNLKNIAGCDFHLLVADAAGKCVVMEWRYNRLYLTYQDAATNFYVAFDDAEDSYRGGRLKEKFVRAQGLTRNYRYGYGHGYGRFNILAEMLERHATESAECGPATRGSAECGPESCEFVACGSAACGSESCGFAECDPVACATTMSEAEAMDTLKAASQEYDGTDLTSNTQYSVVYNAARLTAEVCVMRDYESHFYFSLNE